MAKYRKKPVEVEVVTFDEFVDEGFATATSIVNGVPWAFTFRGHQITHESDDCYLVPTNHGVVRFNRGEVLIVGVGGEIYPCKAEIFEATYEPVA